MEPPAERDAITVSVPPRAEFIHVLRAVTASVASRAGLSFDDIEDLRLAVDEASARLLMLRSGASALVARLDARADRLEVVVALDAAVGEWPIAGLEESLSWRVLLALVDVVRPEMARIGPAIRLVKRAPIQAPER